MARGHSSFRSHSHVMIPEYILQAQIKSVIDVHSAVLRLQAHSLHQLALFEGTITRTRALFTKTNHIIKLTRRTSLKMSLLMHSRTNPQKMWIFRIFQGFAVRWWVMRYGIIWPGSSLRNRLPHSAQKSWICTCFNGFKWGQSSCIATISPSYGLLCCSYMKVDFDLGPIFLVRDLQKCSGHGVERLLPCTTTKKTAFIP